MFMLDILQYKPRKILPTSLFAQQKNVYMRINLQNHVQTVTEITRSIKGILENGFSFIAVSGEVSNLRRPYSGHLYFTLKDSKSQLKAVLFKPQGRYLSKPIKDGDQIICRGRISLYEARGDYQIIVDSVDFTGSGALQIAFEHLKQKLAAQGLFAESNKKALPLLPKKIAVITSPQGAAVHDFIKIAAKRFPGIPVEIYPAPMQGEQAAKEIITALQLIHSRQTCNVIVICRGGGSIEDLWPFNNEQLAKAVFNSKIPIISAIGHEIDFTILDFVADYRASTPTAAAEAALPDRHVLQQKINQLKHNMKQIITNKMSVLQHRLEAQTRLLTTPSGALQGIRFRTKQAELNLRRNMANQLAAQRIHTDTLITELYRHSPQYKITTHRKTIAVLKEQLKTQANFNMERKIAVLQKSAALLDAVSPLAVLARGYSIARVLPGKVTLRSTKQIVPGDQIDLRIHDGSLKCQVTTVIPK